MQFKKEKEKQHRQYWWGSKSIPPYEGLRSKVSLCLLLFCLLSLPCPGKSQKLKFPYPRRGIETRILFPQNQTKKKKKTLKTLLRLSSTFPCNIGHEKNSTPYLVCRSEDPCSRKGSASYLERRNATQRGQVEYKQTGLAASISLKSYPLYPSIFLYTALTSSNLGIKIDVSPWVLESSIWKLHVSL